MMSNIFIKVKEPKVPVIDGATGQTVYLPGPVEYAVEIESLPDVQEPGTVLRGPHTAVDEHGHLWCVSGIILAERRANGSYEGAAARAMRIPGDVQPPTEETDMPIVITGK